MSPQIKKAAGYDSFRRVLDSVTGSQEVNVYFIGTKNEAGENWCPDCNRAEPHVMAAVDRYAKTESIFLVVEVGDSKYWKDRSNPFRKDSNFHVQMLPTLARWKSVARLDGSQCNRDDLLEMFFTED